MDNALLLADVVKLAQEASNIEEVYELVRINFMESFLFDEEQLSLKKYDEHYGKYVSAVDIYNEFEKIDNKLSNKKNYSTYLMLEVMKELTGDRYKAFENVFDQKYKERPQMTIKEYLEYFNDQMKKMGDKLEFGWYDKGFTKTVQNRVSKSIAETILYLRAIGQWKLADDILVYYKDPLEKPKLPKETIPPILKYHAQNMVKKCKIQKKEATALLNNEIKKLFS